MQKPAIPRDALTGLLMVGSLLAFAPPVGAGPSQADPVSAGSVSAGSVSANPAPAVALPFEQAVFAGLPPREPWIAAGLSLAITGSGQFYNRDSAKGFWLFGTLATYPVAMAIDAWTGSGYARVSAFTLMMAAKGYSVWDAYHTASASASATP